MFGASTGQGTEEARKNLRLDRLDLAPQASQGTPPQLPQDVGIGELVCRAAGSERSLQQRARGGERAQRPLDRGARDPPAGGRLIRGERGVAARPAQQERIQRRLRRLEPRLPSRTTSFRQDISWD